MTTKRSARKEIVDILLQQAGWNVSERAPFKDTTIPYASHQYGDCVLLGMDGKLLTVVEAKNQ